MAKSGYGIKVETDTGHFLWLAKKGTHRMNTYAMSFETEKAADLHREFLEEMNPHAKFKTMKLSK